MTNPIMLPSVSFRGRELRERSPESITTSPAVVASRRVCRARLGLWIPVASGEQERRTIVKTS